MRRPASPDRFFTRPMAVALSLYGLFAVTFSAFQIKGDALVYFNLLRRFFGEHPDFAFAYQFGGDVWNTPFFLVGKGLGAIFGFEPRIFHVSFEELAITAATQASFLLTLYVAWRLLRELHLPATPVVLFLAVFGSPLFYYVVFEPAMKHAVDTLYITAAVLALLLVHTRDRDRDPLVLGALAGVSANTRYVNVAFFAVVAVSLSFGRRRAVMLAGAAAVAVGLIVFTLPALRGISYFEPSYFPRSAVGRLAIGAHPMVAGTTNPLNGLDPLIPFKMLFTDHRGLFVWTPLTALAAIGFALRLRAEQDAMRRRFLWTLLAASVGLLAGHTAWAEWDGAFSFSTRFLTALFPLIVIGVAELSRRLGRRLYPLFALCVAWSLMLAFVHVVGYDGITAGDSATDEARMFVRNPSSFVDKVDKLASRRWGYLDGLAHGTDPEHVHGP